MNGRTLPTTKGIFFEVLVAILPATLVGHLKLPHERVVYGLALIVGVLLQGLTPPRRGLVPVSVITLMIVMIYVLM